MMGACVFDAVPVCLWPVPVAGGQWATTTRRRRACTISARGVCRAVPPRCNLRNPLGARFSLGVYPASQQQRAKHPYDDICLSPEAGELSPRAPRPTFFVRRGERESAQAIAIGSGRAACGARPPPIQWPPPMASSSISYPLPPHLTPCAARRGARASRPTLLIIYDPRLTRPGEGGLREALALGAVALLTHIPT
eukprot:scaffold19308_cov170-Isochrysis_galbana.AAC.2